MKKQRRTAQLAATWEVLAQAKDHPSAEEVLRRVRHRLPRVSLGTVYRNLDKLRGLGHLQVLRFDAGVARYDATVEEHDHFVCDSCGTVMDLMRPAAACDLTAVQREGFVIRAQSTTFYGTCPDCVKNIQRQAAGESSPSPCA
jgi:Fe2+ or Zn2+ uptake regulation protein